MRNLTLEQKIDIIYNKINTNDRMLDTLNILSALLGFYNVWLNRKQIDNNSIMKELDKQDRVYLDKIIKILEEMKGETNDNK